MILGLMGLSFQIELIEGLRKPNKGHRGNYKVEKRKPKVKRNQEKTN